MKQADIRVEWTDIETRRIRPRPKKPLRRSSGVHLSGVTKYVLAKAGLLNVEDKTDEMPLRMCVGMAWEDWVVGLWPKMKWQPGEVTLDGVTGSPDGLTRYQKLDKGPRVTLLEEFKATWKSSHTRQDITQEKVWMWQLMGYCKMLKLNHARLHVFWINGDYRPPSPKYMTYLLKFTNEELDKFWVNVILANKEHAEEEVHA